MESKPIRIAPAKDFEECFVNSGVCKALEFAFKHPDFKMDIESDEYAEFVRAYWYLAPNFSDTWRVKASVVTACAEDGNAI